VPDLLAAADVFVLASRYEGNPLVVMEAMAAGRPVVATAVGCLPELVSDETGRLVPAGDGPALSAAMVALAGDRRLADRLGAAAAAVALARFDVRVMARAYRALFDRLRPEEARPASGVSQAASTPS
jgi:glycosyltransferase involved in cell wall biosynthesis